MTARAYAYAQARLQARFGEMPGASVWEGLHSLVELPALLDQMRMTPLRRWILNISFPTPPHEMERLLRRHMHAQIEDVAHWLPAAWRPAVRWTGILLDLPALAHLFRGGEAYAWMQEEPALRELAALDPAMRASAAAHGRYASFLQLGRDEALATRWLTEWRSRWPDANGRERAALEQLVKAARAHLSGFAEGRGESGQAARERFRREVTILFRRHALTPAAAFAWLLLAALEFELVRGAVVERALYAPGSD
jgi:hypothetical protein